ncbi:MAG: hypothetical protein JKY13_03545 [Gammaproteobacteria bacterium]|nr:hypothetical protein [Gammaproteobacteria bacterium]
MTIHSFEIPADHPCLAGHFPDHPIVPAVVILDHLLAIIHNHCIDRTITTIDKIKFIHPLLPQQICQVDLQQQDHHINFTCLVDNTMIAVGNAQ